MAPHGFRRPANQQQYKDHYKDGAKAIIMFLTKVAKRHNQIKLKVVDAVKELLDRHSIRIKAKWLRTEAIHKSLEAAEEEAAASKELDDLKMDVSQAELMISCQRNKTLIAFYNLLILDNFDATLWYQQDDSTEQTLKLACKYVIAITVFLMNRGKTAPRTMFAGLLGFTETTSKSIKVVVKKMVEHNVIFPTSPESGQYYLTLEVLDLLSHDVGPNQRLIRLPLCRIRYW